MTSLLTRSVRIWLTVLGLAAPVAAGAAGMEGVAAVAGSKTGYIALRDQNAAGLIDLRTGALLQTIPAGLRPAGLTLAGGMLFAAGAGRPALAIIDTIGARLVRTIDIPAGPAASGDSASVAVAGSVAYVTLPAAGAIAVLDLSGSAANPLMGFIPAAHPAAPVAYDPAENRLLLGAAEAIPLPSAAGLAAMTAGVAQSHHWTLPAGTGLGKADPAAAPAAIPAHIGEPSPVKHVFLIVKENRTYDQVFGDDPRGNGDASLAVFGQTATPNQHALVRRFPLADNYYDPSRPPAGSHPWLLQTMVPHTGSLQSPDWGRSSPAMASSAVAYSPNGFLWTAAANAGIAVKNFGLHYNYNEFANNPATGQPYTWTDYYNDAKAFESGAPALKLGTTIKPVSDMPALNAGQVPNFPIFELGVPDQFRVDLWQQNFLADEAAGTLPALTLMWIMCDHTSGTTPGAPTPSAAVADNDLAVGRIVDTISHSKDWPSSAVFVTEDDTQNGVDHVDGHRSTLIVASPYAVQTGLVDHTYYNQMNLTRTIEQILGLQPVTLFDLVAAPMTTLFTGTPDAAPFNHLPANIPLDTLNAGPRSSSDHSLPALWSAASADMFRGKFGLADAVDPDVLNHIDWYAATNFTRPYPGESRVRAPGEFAQQILNPAPNGGDD